MTPSQVIKLFVPPIIGKILNRLSPPALTDWYEGPFAEPPENVGPDPFASQSWSAHIRKCLDDLEQLDYRHTGFNNHDLILSLLTSMHGGTVLDFGGGAGVGYPWAVSQHKTRYIVVDGEASMNIGRAYWRDGQIEFQSDIPPHADIVNCNGTLHCIREWRDALKALLATKPKYFLLSRHLTAEGIGAEMYCIQHVAQHGNYVATLIPERELLAVFGAAGYRTLGNWQQQNLAYRCPGWTLSVTERTLLLSLNPQSGAR